MSFGKQSQKTPSEEELERFEQLKKVPPSQVIAPPCAVGEATVERIVAQDVRQAKMSQGRTCLVVMAAAIVLFLAVAAVGAFSIWRSM